LALLLPEASALNPVALFSLSLPEALASRPLEHFSI